MQINRYKLKTGCTPPLDDKILGQRAIMLSDKYEISLMIEFESRKPKDITENFDLEYFLVLDEEFCQPYMPFYIAAMESENNSDNPCLQEVILKYNEVMDKIDWLERVR